MSNLTHIPRANVLKLTELYEESQSKLSDTTDELESMKKYVKEVLELDCTAAVLGCLGWSIEQHLNDIPTKLKPTFQQILNDIKARKENLERS
jgi:hypothetical protein